MARACRGKLLTIAVLAAAFLATVPHAGVDGAQLQQMKALLAKQVKDRHLAGMAAIVVRADSVLGVAAAGVRKQGEAAPIQTGDLFHLGSNGKAITATLIARLIEAGKLSFATTPLNVLPVPQRLMRTRVRQGKL